MRKERKACKLDGGGEVLASFGAGGGRGFPVELRFVGEEVGGRWGLALLGGGGKFPVELRFVGEDFVGI